MTSINMEKTKFIIFYILQGTKLQKYGELLAITVGIKGEKVNIYIKVILTL